MRFKKIVVFLVIISLVTAVGFAKSKPKKKKTTVDTSNMALVPEGEFVMGDDSGESDEKPAHKVMLKAFLIDKYEVTVEQYELCVAAGNCKPAEKYADTTVKKLPVVGVSYEDAAAYCAWLQKRLPTEAEWEKAARGADARKYPWGNTIDCSRANYRECGAGRTLPVGSYPDGASPYGVYDLAGNAWEWVADWYGEQYYKESYQPNAPALNPTGPISGKFRVTRGGSWNRPMYGLRSADRAGFKPETRSDDLGFRCALDNW